MLTNSCAGPRSREAKKASGRMKEGDFSLPPAHSSSRRSLKFSPIDRRKENIIPKAVNELENIYGRGEKILAYWRPNALVELSKDNKKADSFLFSLSQMPQSVGLAFHGSAPRNKSLLGAGGRSG
ncbi:hypothetical protein L596_005328 [Steinernema carpocapsae]|uniref:Uncharacterized protein n=1 Tax=Steinernema carpocapsae TaxID=34508 RepID=A0A4U8UYX1_STECR|nr:hypothetical protein L596_005328 [Steinernema carpocapsae]